jgi:moderate conductance mechanosensitive channel
MGSGLDSQTIEDTCGTDPSWVCQQVLEETDGNEFLARTADFLIAKPAQILLIVGLAFVANRLVRRAIHRFTDRVASGQELVRRTLRDHGPDVLTTPQVSGRAAARAQTIGNVMRGIATVIIYSIAGLLILGELGINLGPLLAGAGIAGVALGFGAQSLVKDCISGTFMVIEDQFGVGDVVDVGEASGVVEAVSLRATRLRDAEGTVWHVPNGEILRVGNKSQQWARAVVDVPVAHGADLRHAEGVLARVAEEVANDPAWSAKVLEPPEMLGVETYGPEGVTLRVTIKTKPAEQWAVMRELRLRLKEAFEHEGIALPLPANSLVMQETKPVRKTKASPAQA